MLDGRDQILIAQLTALCQQTGAVILSYYGQQARLNIETKSNNTPLTEADLAAHQHLINGLPTILDIPLISEESPTEEHLRQHHDYWLIDPIDGTREFIEQTGEFCIAIARITAHRPVLAFIYAPITDEYWYAIAGKGAYKGTEYSQPMPLQCKVITSPISIITARRKLTKRMQSYLNECFDDYEQTTAGSALKFCRIAEGKADIYPKIASTTSEWDTAAGDLILHEAGGGMRFSNGRVPYYGHGESTLNPPFIAYGAGLSEECITQYCAKIEQIEQIAQPPQP